MKKSIFLFVFACLGLQPLSASTFLDYDHRKPHHSNPHSEAQVTLFKETGFRGEALMINGDWSCELDRDFCFTIESIIIPRGYEVWLYRHRKFNGDPVVLNSSWDGSGAGSYSLRNRIRSIRIIQRRQAVPRFPRSGTGSQVIVYDQFFQGRQMVLNGNWTVSRHNGFDFNDCINAIYVPRGYVVRIFEDANYSGRYQDIYGDWRVCQQDFWFARISSIMIMRARNFRTRRSN